MNNHIYAIECIFSQCQALLDLMVCSSDRVDTQSMRTTAEMCVTLLDEMKVEIDQMEIENLKENEDDSKECNE